ncbi:MAG: hypothetical protein ACQXXJ_07220 [Candidatus Bathyarchaeia archaeon]|jgi:hypothetical protein
MKDNAEIPCASCKFWKKDKKTFSCNPNNCTRLNNWLISHVHIDLGAKMQLQIEKPQLQYIV